MERKYVVYRHTCPNGKVYIGITKQFPENRWKNGIGYKSSPHFWNAIQKYGWENIKHEILHSELPKDDACKYEREYIESHNSTDRRFGYNEKSGGEIGVIFSEIVRKKISDGEKEFYKLHPEKREEISRRITGFHHSEESKKKMSIAKTGTHFVMTDEWKRKIGESNKRTYSENTELRNSAANRMREYGLSKSIKVEQLDLDGNVIATYDSLHDASRKTGVRNGNISRVCRGICKTAGGYNWRYAVNNSSRETA